MIMNFEFRYSFYDRNTLGRLISTIRTHLNIIIFFTIKKVNKCQKRSNILSTHD